MSNINLHNIVQSKWEIGDTIAAEEKLAVIRQLEKVNELLTHAVMLESLIVAYVQFVIMLIELKN